MSEQVRLLASRWFEEVWNQRRRDVIRELFAPEAIAHLEGRDVKGPEEFERVRDEMIEAMPDLRIIVEEIVVEGDNAVVRWVCQATHRGSDLVADGGRVVQFGGLTWMKFRNGQIVEGWDRWNQAGLYFRPDIAEST